MLDNNTYCKELNRIRADLQRLKGKPDYAANLLYKDLIKIYKHTVCVRIPANRLEAHRNTVALFLVSLSEDNFAVLDFALNNFNKYANLAINILRLFNHAAHDYHEDCALVNFLSSRATLLLTLLETYSKKADALYATLPYSTIAKLAEVKSAYWQRAVPPKNNRDHIVFASRIFNLDLNKKTNNKLKSHLYSLLRSGDHETIYVIAKYLLNFSVSTSWPIKDREPSLSISFNKQAKRTMQFNTKLYERVFSMLGKSSSPLTTGLLAALVTQYHHDRELAKKDVTIPVGRIDMLNLLNQVLTYAPKPTMNIKHIDSDEIYNKQVLDFIDAISLCINLNKKQLQKFMAIVIKHNYGHLICNAVRKNKSLIKADELLVAPLNTLLESKDHIYTVLNLMEILGKPSYRAINKIKDRSLNYHLWLQYLAPKFMLEENRENMPHPVCDRSAERDKQKYFIKHYGQTLLLINVLALDDNTKLPNELMMQLFQQIMALHMSALWYTVSAPAKNLHSSKFFFEPIAKQLQPNLKRARQDSRLIQLPRKALAPRSLF